MQPGDSRLTLGRFLEDVTARHGDRVAVVFEGQETTYAQLHAEARAIARGLLGAGVAKGAHVALWMANRPEWIASAFAVGMTGAVLVPLNTFAKPGELRHILRHGDACALLLQPSLQHQRLEDVLLAAHPEIERGKPGCLRVSALPQLRQVFALGRSAPRGGVLPWEALRACGDDVSDALLDAAIAEVEPSDPGILVYTSGTTAQPKGVMHAQRAGVLQAWRFAELLRLGPEDRVFTTYPFFWTAGIAMSIGGAFAAGARLLLQEIFEAGAALDLIEGERATALHAWPHQQKSLGEHPSAASRDLSSVSKVEFTSPIAKLAGVERDVYGAGATYGLSETFTLVSALPADAPAEERSACSGRPLPGNTIRIVDPETGAPLPAGQAGEIAVKGPTLMLGYHKVAPELVFDAEGFFRTQDGGHFDADGRLHWTGRLGNLVKTGGANVSPAEIQELLEAHPALKLGIPVGVPHPTLGEALVLCAVAVEGAEPDEEAIRAWLRERVARYKVPRRVLFFSAGSLAYTANQKVQVGPLRDAARKRLEEERAVIAGYRYEPPEAEASEGT